ncbi:hypothetical protein [Arthrobacter sp. JSM 101049]|uniref:putative phage holin n=1 Tax=Arthrobacter sp. JSM 101049 TaxID=929097 RepID=UPI0035654E46
MSVAAAATAILTLAVAVTGTFGLGIYTAVIPWWRSSAGRAYFSIFSSLILVAWHFVLEVILGQSPPWVEPVLILVVLAAIVFNIQTALRKQIHGWRRRRAG